MRPASGRRRVRFVSWAITSSAPGENKKKRSEVRALRLTDVVVPPRELAVLGRLLRELGLGHEAVGLLVQAVLEVVAQEEREERRLEVVVVAQRGRALRGEEGPAGVRRGRQLVLVKKETRRRVRGDARAEGGRIVARSFVEADPVEVELAHELVERAAVELGEALDRLGRELLAAGVLLVVEERDDAEERQEGVGLGEGRREVLELLLLARLGGLLLLVGLGCGCWCGGGGGGRGGRGRGRVDVHRGSGGGGIRSKWRARARARCGWVAECVDEGGLAVRACESVGERERERERRR